MNLAQYVEFNEGRRHKPYKDHEGRLTIGVGQLLEDGLTDRHIDALLEVDLDDARTIATKWLGCAFYELNEARRIVVQDMAFNLGYPRLSGFKKTRAALLAKDYETAADEILDSEYARHDVPERAGRNAIIMRSGVMEW